jgi:hypothetical protein
MPVSGLDEDCATCGKRSGSHTLDEWAACMATTETVEFTEDTDSDVAAQVRRRFGGISDDTLIADHCLVEAAILDGADGQVGVKVPAVIHNFGLGEGAEVKPVARVLYLSDVTGMRNYGALVQKSVSASARQASE